MSVKIRLARGGRKKIARYRIVAADSRCPRDGRFIEILGYYNPQVDQKEFKINVERIGYWLKHGAHASVTVRNLLKQDRFADRLEAVDKGLNPETLNLERLPEKPRRAGKRKKAAKES